MDNPNDDLGGENDYIREMQEYEANRLKQQQIEEEEFQKKL